MKRIAVACFFQLVLVTAANATDRYYPDIHVNSASGRYRVDATSPDNKGNGFKPFQANFTYTCTDTSSDKLIWTRKQAMEKPRRLSKDSDRKFTFSKEASPVSIFVSNNGSTLIYNGADDLIIVSPQGVDKGKIDILKDALTEAENSQFVHETTAGPYWTGLSEWYYLPTTDRDFFVIRPWWGRRIFVDMKKGDLADTTAALTKAAIETEKKLVITTLSLEQEPGVDDWSKYGAAYLAGVLKLKKAIPYLRTLEKSTEIDSSTTGGLSFGEDFDNEVDPHSYSTNTLRQVAQLSLRRLGEHPNEALPCHTFDLKKNGKSVPFSPKRKLPRHADTQDVKVGMSAKQVIEAIGTPDFVCYDSWSYDMDAETPFSFTLKFDARNVTSIKREAPLWKSDRVRDKSLAY